MSPNENKRAYRQDLMRAALLIAAGLLVSGFSLARIADRPRQLAQATQPLKGTPAPADQDKAPAESMPGGERPTTPAPQPARPDAQAQQQGIQPALPPAPAEKTAPPIREK